MENRIYYRVTFNKPGCCYDRGFTNEDERNRFADSMKKAGFEDIDFTNKYAAIKIHFGEPGNLAYLINIL